MLELGGAQGDGGPLLFLFIFCVPKLFVLIGRVTAQTNARNNLY